MEEIVKKIFLFFKRRHDLKIAVIERERTHAAKQRLEITNRYEKKLRDQAEELRKEFDKELREKLKAKNDEIQRLKDLIKYIKNSGENLQILSKEFELELRGLLVMMGKIQNRFTNIEYRAHKETQRIDKKIDKYIGMEDIE